MRMTIIDVDYAPEELHDQLPVVAELFRQIPGTDRPDYWLGCLARPISWFVAGVEREITHLVVAARWAGDRVTPGACYLPVNLAYVTDPSLLEDERLQMTKCAYVAIGVARVEV